MAAVREACALMFLYAAIAVDYCTGDITTFMTTWGSAACRSLQFGYLDTGCLDHIGAVWCEYVIDGLFELQTSWHRAKIWSS